VEGAELDGDGADTPFDGAGAEPDAALEGSGAGTALDGAGTALDGTGTALDGTGVGAALDGGAGAVSADVNLHPFRARQSPRQANRLDGPLSRPPTRAQARPACRSVFTT
jgi:hypothetical protein